MITQEITHFHLFGGAGSGAVSTELKIRARKLLHRAVIKGRVVPQPCEKCNAPKAQGHHEDYLKPLAVHWLCPACHSKLHNQRYPLTKACIVCNAVFTPHPTKRARAKTCSPECRVVAIKQALALRPPPRPPQTKLDDARAEQIRLAYSAGGETHRSLAKSFGVHHSQIGCIVRGEAWR